MGTKVYFFSSTHYARYDRGDDRVDDGYPLAIGEFWRGMAAAGFGTGIEAALNWGDGRLYFFKGDQYVRFNVADDKVDDGYPLRIADHWNGLAAAGFGSGLDTAVNWGNGKVYFFKGDRYLRFSIKDDKVDDGYPLRIADHWPGFAAAGFGSGIDAALTWGNGKVFFFKDDKYLRYDILHDRVDDGYPLPIADFWPGMAAAGFGGGMKTCIDLFGGSDLWLPGAQIIPCPVSGPHFIGVPWRGVLHTTEGGSIATNVETYKANGNDFPHLTIDPRHMAVAQHFPLNVGCRALKDDVTPANASNAIQIEICEVAQNAPNWPPEFLAFIKSVIRQVEDLVPIPRASGLRFIAHPASLVDDRANRMGVDAWKHFSGWCGHQHVPGNSHGDPGAIDIEFLIAN